MMYGFTFPYGQKDVFVVSDYTKKCNTLARKILRKMEFPENPDTVKELLYYLKKAECERKPFKTGDWYKIKGDGFGIMSPVNDVILITVNKEGR